MTDREEWKRLAERFAQNPDWYKDDHANWPIARAALKEPSDVE